MSTQPDFPDWLSPMLVKELRQGLRSKAFLSSFLTLQVAMILLTFAGLLVASQGTSAEVTSSLFWVIVGFPILIIMPASGLNAISGEIKENTLELIFLSRLSARRIVIGKWLAILSQILLLLSAILPYLVLRYYLGGVNLATDLLTLGWMLLGSALLTGITIGLSPNTGRVGRALIPVGVVFSLQFLGVFMSSLFNSPVRGSALGVGTSIAFWGTIVGLGVFMLIALLEFGAQKIAPAAENHSTSKRLAAVGVALLCGIYSAFWPGLNSIWIIGGLIMLPIAIGAVCEPIRQVTSLYRPFVQGGLAGRLLARVLLPGWPAGTLFVFLLLLALFLIPSGPFTWIWTTPIGSHIPVPMWSILMTLNLFGFFFFPAALMQIPRGRLIPPLIPFLIIQLISGALALIAHLSAWAYPEFEHFAAMVPTLSLFLGGITYDWPKNDLVPLVIGSASLTGISLIFLLFKMVSAWRIITRLPVNASESSH